MIVTRVAALAAAALFAACSGNPDLADPPASSATVERGGISYSAETAVMESFPVQLATEVTMRNVSGAPVRIELSSGCPVHLRVYRTEELRDPVWDQGSVMICTMAIEEIELAPGETARRSTRASARDILGTSLPDGRYALGAYVALVGGDVLVPAGTVELAVPR